LVAPLFEVEVVSASVAPSNDVRPTQQVAMIVEDAAEAERENRAPVRQLRAARWGLIPSWTKQLDSRFLLINARAETVLDKPSFRTAASRRRAIVPASGYYEWMKNDDGTKTPFFLHDPADSVIGFAGIYEWWKVPDDVEVRGAADGWLCSVSIITRAATDTLGHIHDRMPVVVPPTSADTWLDPTLTDRDEVDAVLNSLPDPVLIPTKRTPR